jgi:hypothetical protein
MDDTRKDAGRRTDYLSYLLRLWRNSEERFAWRASLTSPDTGERVGFASLDDLVRFLRRQIGQASDANGDQDEAGRGGDDTAIG